MMKREKNIQYIQHPSSKLSLDPSPFTSTYSFLLCSMAGTNKIQDKWADEQFLKQSKTYQSTREEQSGILLLGFQESQSILEC